MKVTIAGIQKFSLMDFPGHISAVIFTQGCSFRCGYCHNPQLVLPGQFKRPIPIQAVVDFLIDRKHQLDGVVVTGGEPTLHEDLPSFLGLVKSIGYKIKLDTNGIHPDVLKDIIQKKQVHYIAMDIKSAFYKYPDVTGVCGSGELAQESIRLIIDSGVRHQFRTTVVSPWVSREDVLEIAAFLKGADAYKLQPFKAPENGTIKPVSAIQISPKEISLLQAETDRVLYPDVIQKFADAKDFKMESR